MPTKKTVRQKKNKRKSTRKQNQKKRLYRKRTIKGGNYQTDVTTTSILGEPTMPLPKVVVTKPGYPAMSGEDFVRIQEEIDRNGDDSYT